jgi:hypothetical protein
MSRARAKQAIIKVDLAFIFCPPPNQFEKNYLRMIRRDRGLPGLSVNKDITVFGFVYAL